MRQLHFLILSSTTSSMSFSVFVRPLPLISHHHKLHHLHTAFFSSSSFFISTPAARSFPLLPVFRTPALFFNFFLFSIRLTFNSSTSGSAACASLPASQFENYQSPTLWAPFVARGIRGKKEKRKKKAASSLRFIKYCGPLLFGCCSRENNSLL